MVVASSVTDRLCGSAGASAAAEGSANGVADGDLELVPVVSGGAGLGVRLAGADPAGPSTGPGDTGRSACVLSGVNSGSPIPAITSPATSVTRSSRTTAFLNRLIAAWVAVES